MYHARNFAPVYGVNEDPVTGTANGAVSSYLVKHKIIGKNNFICEQGDIIGRPGRVFVEIRNDEIKLEVKQELHKNEKSRYNRFIFGGFLVYPRIV